MIKFMTLSAPCLALLCREINFPKERLSTVVLLNQTVLAVFLLLAYVQAPLTKVDGSVPGRSNIFL